MAPDPSRQALRLQLRAERERFASDSGFATAHAALGSHLAAVINQLEPQCLGVYWSIRSEFNAVVALGADPRCAGLLWALPYTQRTPRAMHYRQWDRQPPPVHDECGIPASAGAPVVPDVVLVPCVGFTEDGYRLGYGGGYFDRWMAAHPHATAVGVAWSFSAVSREAFGVQAHDQPLMLVVTEKGPMGS